MTKRKSGDLFALLCQKAEVCVSTGNRQEVRGSQVFLTSLISRLKPETPRVHSLSRTRRHPWRARTHTRNTTVTAVCFLPATPSSGCTQHNCQPITNTGSHFQHTPSGPALVPPLQQMVCMSYLLQDGSQVAGGLQRGFSFPL